MQFGGLLMLLFLLMSTQAQSNDDVDFQVDTFAPEVFEDMSIKDPLAKELLAKFMDEYKEEVGRTSLHVKVLGVLKAQRTAVRPELQLDAFEAMETLAQQYRLFALLQYSFGSTMLMSKRPYVSVLRLTMDCVNATDPVSRHTDLNCDVLQHLDLPRTNVSTSSIAPSIKTAIFHAAPSAYVHNDVVPVHFDAYERQALTDKDEDAVDYVRYRVLNATNAADCMVVVTHDTLLFQDNACYDDGMATTASFVLTKPNVPMAIVLLSVVGCIVSFIVLWRHRTQRKGYAYLHSKQSSRLPSTSPKELVNTETTAPAAS